MPMRYWRGRGRSEGSDYADVKSGDESRDQKQSYRMEHDLCVVHQVFVLPRFPLQCLIPCSSNKSANNPPITGLALNSIPGGKLPSFV
jgi:hypothetical protein